MDNPFSAAADKEVNIYLSKSKKELIKICKAQGFPAEYSNNLEDLAFLLFRFEHINKMNAEEVSRAVKELGFVEKNKKANIITLVTFEFCLVDLMDSEEAEVNELLEEFEIETECLSHDQSLVQLAVQMCI